MRCAKRFARKGPVARRQVSASCFMSYEIGFSSDPAQCLDLVQLCRDMDGRTGGGSVLLKDDTPATLQLVDTEIGKLVIKRYNTKNAWHFMRRNFQISRAANCLRMSEEFTKAGIPVPEPIGVVRQRIGPFSGRSWFVSRYMDAESLIEFLKRNHDADSMRFVSDRIRRIFRALQEHRLSHGDMKATNMLVQGNELIMIDLDSARRHVSSARHSRSLDRDRRRFLANWSPWPEMKHHFAEVLSGHEVEES